jgi:uncharacterized protein (TIGR03000 family)
VVVVTAPAAAPAGQGTPPKKMDKLPEPKKNDDETRRRGTPARVLVKAPPEAIVTVNGQRTNRRSAEETFQTPNLRPGHTYSYVFKAEVDRDGEKVTRTRRVVVRAGQDSVVDFSELATRRPAKVKVVLSPGTRARLFVNGAAFGSAAATRTYETPELPVGKRYYYAIKAELTSSGETRTVNRRITVEAGQTATVDLREPAAVASGR